MRKLKHHEQKLLKKVDFYQWKNDNNLKEIAVMRRYHVQKREDYVMYNRMCGLITKLTTRLKKLDARDPFRSERTEQLLDKLYNMGIIPTKKSLSLCDKVSSSAFCRRRLPVVMVRLKMAENMREAVTFVEQGHVRVGPEVVNDPAYLVSRPMEDFVTWVDNSKIKQKIMKYHDKVDDFELLMA